MEVTRRDSLNPDFMRRLKRIQTAQMCRFCLNNNDTALINIMENEHIQMLIQECYHGCLGTLNGNASRFICTNCYQRLEQSYEFLRVANRVQTLVDRYTYHDGLWPLQPMLRDLDVRKGEKRAASPDDENPSKIFRSSRVRFEDAEDDSEMQLGESSSTLSERCPTPGPIKNFTDDKNETSFDTTLSGEIPGSELVHFSGSSSMESSPATDEKETRWRTKLENAAARAKLGEVGRDPSMVSNLCLQIGEIGVSRIDRRNGKVAAAVSAEEEFTNARRSLSFSRGE